MKNESYLKSQLIDFVDVYKKYFRKTFNITVAFTIFTFIIIGLLLKFSDFDPSSTKPQISLLSYFVSSYSEEDTYSLVDLSRIVFVFFVSLFSISLIRSNGQENDSKEYKFGEFMKHIGSKDVLYLTGVLITCAIYDYLLFRFDNFISTSVRNYALNAWIHNISLYLFRNYLPLMFFSFTIYVLTSGKKLKVTLRSICFLFVSLWLMNEFTYELSVFVRSYIFNLVLIPFNHENKFIYESFLGIVLIAFYFVGYYSAMTRSLILLDK